MSAVFHLDAAQANATQAAVEAKPAGAGVLACTIFASGLAFVDSSVVNVGLPAIGKGLEAGSGDLSWVVNAYLLPLGALQLLGGAAGDVYGRRKLLILGTALFGLASLIAALAPNFGSLLMARALQGVGAALLLPNSLAILGAAYSGEARGRAIGIWAAAGAVMGAIGPVLGGWLIDLAGWRTIFLLNLPGALAAIVLAFVFVKPMDRAKAALSLDVWGGILATSALGAVTWGLTIGTGPEGWTSRAVLSCFLGAVLALAFLWTEHIRGEKAMMPLSLFGSPDFIGLSLLTWFLYGALGALMVLVPYVLIVAAGWSAVAAGAALGPFALVLALISPLMGSLAGRFGPRLLLWVSPLVTAAGFLLLSQLNAPVRYWMDAFPGVLLIAIGMSGAVAPLTTAVLSSVDARHTGSASGLNSALARTAGMVATALLGGVLGATGAPLLRGFETGMIVSALAALAASASVFFLFRAGRGK